MGSSSVLLANEPRAYRETIAMAIGVLCPDKHVIIIEPDCLDESIRKYRPHVVLCSRLTETVEKLVPIWAVLYPEGTGQVLAHVAGRRLSLPEIQLNGIVSLIQCDLTGIASA